MEDSPKDGLSEKSKTNLAAPTSLLETKRAGVVILSLNCLWSVGPGRYKLSQGEAFLALPVANYTHYDLSRSGEGACFCIVLKWGIAQ